MHIFIRNYRVVPYTELELFFFTDCTLQALKHKNL